MNISFDPKKNAANLAKHGISFEEAAFFDLLNSHIIIDAEREALAKGKNLANYPVNASNAASKLFRINSL